MALFWAADYIKETLPDGLRERFDEVKCDPYDEPGPDRAGWLPLYNGKTGEVIVKMPGGAATRVSRGKMRKVWSEGLNIQVCKGPWQPPLDIGADRLGSLASLRPR
jgi:hypothetical protein